VTVISVGVAWDDITKGQGKITLTRGDLDGLEQRFYKLTFRTIKTSDNSQKPTYIDDNYGVPLDVELEQAYYEFAEAAPTADYVIDGGTI
jgi:hypothetical protein